VASLVEAIDVSPANERPPEAVETIEMTGDKVAEEAGWRS
jgi:hypothetical protein